MMTSKFENIILPFNLTADQCKRLWGSESFQAVVREKSPCLYIAGKLFGEPCDLERVIRDVVDTPPLKDVATEDLLRKFDELMSMFDDDC